MDARVDSDDEDAPGPPVPVTILTGFLGAGKTSLLRHVLTEPHGLKIAVVQNEMSAAVGLEEATVRGPNGEEFAEWMELANGCVCCAVRDDLVQCMEKLVQMKSFDYVLIETTGMADPGPVAASFWLDDALESPLKLDGIVTVVDGHNLSKQLGTLEACRQVSPCPTAYFR
jgi:G3E family GTPase